MKSFLHKLTHWEYWSFNVVYFPMHFVWLYYSLRAKSLFFFNASNPRITNAGFLMESKKMIYDQLPEGSYPKTILIEKGSKFESIENKLKEHDLQYPLIAKPDIGLQGLAVSKILNDIELANYHAKVNFDFLIQEYIDLPNELGVFYVRYPGEEVGKITGIVAKEFLIVSGDGVSSIEEFVSQVPRYLLQIEALRKVHGDYLKTVLPIGEVVNLVPYGNHARGSKFIDATAWASVELNRRINEICLQVSDFHYGRLDVRYNTFEELEKGEKFSIIELNGAGSEPTHIYDPKHSIFFAWKEIAKHFKMLFEISMINHRKGHRFLSFKEGMKMLKMNKVHLAELKKI